MSDWNGDGLNDGFDEAHEFGIDLDGGSDMVSDGFDAGLADDVLGVDLGLLVWLDVADLLGADLVPVDGLAAGATADLTAGGDAPAGVQPVPLPTGEAFHAALDDPAPDPGVLAGWLAGLRVLNPFHQPDAPDAPDTPQA